MVPTVSGHAIEARLYAEDPLNDFLPVTGLFHRFTFPTSDGLRVDSGIADGSEVSVHYDPMIAKVIAYGPTRETATSRLSTALRQAQIHGSITNRALLVRILESEEFHSGATDTHFLERNDLTDLARPLADPTDEAVAAVAAAFADQAYERSRAGVLSTIQSGWRNSPSQLQTRAYSGSHGEHEVAYTLSSSGFELTGVGRVALVEARPGSATFTVDSAEHHYAVARYGDLRFVDSDIGPADLIAISRFPSSGLDEDIGSLHSPMPGKLIRVDVGVGDTVAEGQVLVVLEAMKMEHTLRSPHDGTVTEVRFRSGDQVEADAVLVMVEGVDN
jgi:propionyl-CoA carboxylase alpha chain